MSCKIYLDNYSGVYYAGNEIRGRLECYFKDETTVRGIKIRLRCKEYNEWTSTESYTDPVSNKSRTRTVTNTGENYIIRTEQMLFGSESGSRQLGSGKRSYDFIFILPNNIPSSYKGPYGSVSYKIKGVVDRPMKTDYEDEIKLNVLSPIDLNREHRNHQEAVTYSDEKNTCCWCCKGGNISLDVELPKTAFAVGERVPFKVQVSNMSNSNVEELKIKLQKKITYRVTSPHRESKSDEEKVLVMQEHGVGAHGEHIYDLSLNIPEHVEVPNFACCDLFSVEYELSVNLTMPTCVLDLEINVYPKLGHVASSSEDPPLSGIIYAEQQQSPPEFPKPDAAPYPPLLPSGGAIFPPYPPVGQIGFTQPGATGMVAPPSYPQNPVYPPTAPFGEANPKASEAAGNPGPAGPSAPEQPPPSYSEAYPHK